MSNQRVNVAVELDPATGRYVAVVIPGNVRAVLAATTEDDAYDEAERIRQGLRGMGDG